MRKTQLGKSCQSNTINKMSQPQETPQNNTVCYQCNGTGRISKVVDEICFDCNGKGWHKTTFLPQVMCHPCRGTGKVKTIKQVSCPHCNGNGKTGY